MNSLFVRFIACVFLSLAFCSSAFCETEVDRYTNEIVKMLEPHVITLSRDINVFHWTESIPYNLKDLRTHDPIFAKVALANMNRFWFNVQKEEPERGLGLYSAIDPASTNYYGQSVLQITLKKGTRILSTASGLAKFIAGYFTDIRNSYFDTASVKEIAFLKKQIARELGIVGWTYDFGLNAKNDICLESQKAMVLIGNGSGGLPTSIEISGIAQRALLEDAQASDFYARIISFREASPKAIYLANLYDHPSAPLTEAQKQYWREHIFACTKNYSEDFTEQVQ
jgi:hypothetical protein